MKTRNLFLKAVLAASVIAILTAALHSTSASMTSHGGSLTGDQDDGGVSANVGFILFTTDRDNPSPLGMCAYVRRDLLDAASRR